jgi:hypothetical protein
MSMSAKKVFFAALLGMCWSWGTAQAQGLYPQSAVPPPTTRQGEADKPGAETAQEGGTGLSSWITYERDDGSIGEGGGMPILTELAFRVGPSFPMGGEFFSRNLNTGWIIEGGARALFFNRSWSKAWGVELGISNTYNPSTSTKPAFLDHFVNQPVTLRSLDRTFANAGFGREWYVWGAANSSGKHLRVGADFGGRYGSAKVEFNEIKHHNQVIEGIYSNVHADLEIPWGRCTYLAGVRGEYSFTWSNIFQQGRGHMEDMSLLFSVGVRY